MSAIGDALSANTGITGLDFRYTGFLVSGRQIVRLRVVSVPVLVRM
jgi:hypothetical protein